MAAIVLLLALVSALCTFKGVNSGPVLTAQLQPSAQSSEAAGSTGGDEAGDDSASQDISDAEGKLEEETGNTEASSSTDPQPQNDSGNLRANTPSEETSSAVENQMEESYAAGDSSSSDHQNSEDAGTLTQSSDSAIETTDHNPQAAAGTGQDQDQTERNEEEVAAEVEENGA